MINSMRKKITAAATILALTTGAGLAMAMPAEAASTQQFWFGTKAACNTALDKARPGFGSYVRLVNGCIANGNGYAYRVAYRTS